MSKPSPQPHVDYLLTTIETDIDPAIAQCGKVFRQSRDAYVAGTLTQFEVETGLAYLAKLVIPTTRSKHHAEKLFAATIEYIIDPERKIKV